MAEIVLVRRKTIQNENEQIKRCDLEIHLLRFLASQVKTDTV
jgi:hypothetical protein